MYPFVVAAGLFAAYFALVAVQRPRPAAILAVVLWSVYAVYEYYVANGTLCDANCNIRVDLLLFWPLLGWATYLALQREPRNGAVAVLLVVCLALVGGLAPMFGFTAVGVVATVAALLAAVWGIRTARSGEKA